MLALNEQKRFIGVLTGLYGDKDLVYIITQMVMKKYSIL